MDKNNLFVIVISSVQITNIIEVIKIKVFLIIFEQKKVISQKKLVWKEQKD